MLYRFNKEFAPPFQPFALTRLTFRRVFAPKPRASLCIRTHFVLFLNRAWIFEFGIRGLNEKVFIHQWLKWIWDNFSFVTVFKVILLLQKFMLVTWDISGKLRFKFFLNTYLERNREFYDNFSISSPTQYLHVYIIQLLTMVLYL